MVQGQAGTSARLGGSTGDSRASCGRASTSPTRSGLPVKIAPMSTTQALLILLVAVLVLVLVAYLFGEGRRMAAPFVLGGLILASLLAVAVIVAMAQPRPPLATCSGGPVPSGGLTFMTTQPDGSLVCIEPP